MNSITFATGKFDGPEGRRATRLVFVPLAWLYRLARLFSLFLAIVMGWDWAAATWLYSRGVLLMGILVYLILIALISFVYCYSIDYGAANDCHCSARLRQNFRRMVNYPIIDCTFK
jgi:hypothetical protein